jgi:hypothetical protein
MKESSTKKSKKNSSPSIKNKTSPSPNKNNIETLTVWQNKGSSMNNIILMNA